ncbi:MAG: hypothetical protein ABFD70_10000 [Syntrophaceae bacterium]
MEDRTLSEDDIIDLTDLLEEGKAPVKPQQTAPGKRMANEPDSFDLGKEISMEYDISVEEIEHDAEVLATDKSPGFEKESVTQAGALDERVDLSREPLGDIEAEIDQAIQDKEKYEEVSLTSNEEEMLLKEEPTEREELLLSEEVPAAHLLDAGISARDDAPDRMVTEPASRVGEVRTEDMPQDTGSISAQDVPSASTAAVPAEVITGALISELKADMPAILDSIVRPLVKELLQEVVSATREAVPSLVEKVIREEIEKLKKI